VHYEERRSLDAAIKALDGKVVEIPDGPKFKLQVRSSFLGHFTNSWSFLMVGNVIGTRQKVIGVRNGPKFKL
jgi:hypothetical protein